MMISLAAIVVAAAARGVPDVPPPPPTPLTDVQREMLVSGVFEADSFREPAFEALIENVRSWPAQTDPTNATDLSMQGADSIARLIERDPGAFVIAGGEVMMVDPVGDAFPGVTRVTLRIGDHSASQALLVFLVDGPTPAMGEHVTAVGRAYKVMQLSTQKSEAPSSFPAMVGRVDPLLHIAHATAPGAGAAIITALTGALAVVLFGVIVGRHMLGKNRPPRPPLASTGDRSDDASDA